LLNETAQALRSHALLASYYALTLCATDQCLTLMRLPAPTIAAPKKVSIVTIFWNAERFVTEAIESVLAQTYRNWELLLVDDGSSDASTLIAREYVARYPERIRYLEHAGHQNRGKSASRNLGVRNASGEYVAFLDSDDVFLPEKLERQVAILDRHPTAAMTYGPSLYWHGWTGSAEDLKRDWMSELGIEAGQVIEPPQLMTLYLTNGGYVPCTCGWMVRREALEPAGGSEESFKDLYEDQVFLAKIVLNYPVHVDGASWDKYRQHSDMSTIRLARSGQYPLSGPYCPQAIYYRWLMTYAAGRATADRHLRAALKRANWRHDHPMLYSLIQKGARLRRRVLAVPSRVRRLITALIHLFWRGRVSAPVPPLSS
jgi:glycosyltransferase involved in cell wall biosynthesis